jgi:glycosidase
MPINPIGEKNRKGTLGSYYAVQDYLGVNKDYGTLLDLKALVKNAHELGMHVIIDWVANHTAWENILITTHPDWYTHDSTGKIISPVADWTDVADLNYDQPGLRQYMTDAMIYWVRAADIDGFRCDVAGMVPLDFWNAAVPEIKKVKNVFMLAEDETPAIHKNGFDMTYSWNLRNLLEEVIKGKKTATALDSLLAKEKDEFPADAYRMHFTSNHDINSWEGSEYERMGKNRCRVLLYRSGNATDLQRAGISL